VHLTLGQGTEIQIRNIAVKSDVLIDQLQLALTNGGTSDQLPDATAYLAGAWVTIDHQNGGVTPMPRGARGV
jgi:hypothetical protein